jgi:hypothetical protein
MNQEYFKQAELALAAYANLAMGVDVKDELKIAGFSDVQADAFIFKYRIVDQYNDGTGLSVTVFEEIVSGQKYLTIRGTEPAGNDLTADGLLAAGLPSNLSPQFIALKAQLDDHWLVDGTLGSLFTVSGHSLGGYLAAAIKQSYSQVTEAYLYNAPGVGGLLGNLADALSSALGLSSITPTNIWNIRSSEGFPVIAGLGYQLGSAVSIQTEASINNHGIGLLTDALATQSLYSQLAPNLGQNQLNALIDAFGSTKDVSSNSKTLESALDALRFITSGPNTNRTGPDNRDTFYTNLKNLQDNPNFTALVGTAQLTVFSGLSASEIMAIANSDGAQGLAARYALTALNPFVLTGANYDAFSGNGALERFDPAGGTGKITDEYLSDRTNFLVRELWFNTQDKNPYNPGAGEPVPGKPVFENESRYFEDAATGYKIQ